MRWSFRSKFYAGEVVFFLVSFGRVRKDVANVGTGRNADFPCTTRGMSKTSLYTAHPYHWYILNLTLDLTVFSIYFQGLALIDRDSRPHSIVYFPSSDLSEDITER